MTDEYQIDGKTWAEKDASGNISANVDSVNTEEINKKVNLSSLVRSGKASDVLDAIEYAQTNIFGDDGGVVTLERGVHDASTAVTVDKPLCIEGEGAAAVDSGVEPQANAMIRWAGGAESPITFKVTSDTPTNELGGISVRNFAIAPDTQGDGLHGLFFDASDNPIRNLQISNVVVQGFGGAGVRVSGDVFGADTHRLGLQGNGQNGTYYDYHEDSGGTASPERVHHYAPFWIADRSGVGAARIKAIDGSVFGGNIQDTSGNGLEGVRITGAGSGGIYDTHIEGKSQAGTGVVIEAANTGTFDVRPSRIFNWDIGVQIGVGNNNSIQKPLVSTAFNNIATADVTYNDSFGLSKLQIEQTIDSAGIDWASFPSAANNRDLSGAVGTYVGDGTDDGSNVIDSGTLYRCAIVSDNTNTLIAFRVSGGGTYNATLEGTANGGISLENSGGIAAFDGGSDSFPNTDGQTYQYLKLE